MRSLYTNCLAVAASILFISAGLLPFNAHSANSTLIGFRLKDINAQEVNTKPPLELLTWYYDSDSDGFGDPASFVVDSVAPQHYVLDNTDCNDQNNLINPGAAEVCNNLDDNCNGETDEGVQSVFYSDNDSDGFGSAANSITACTAPTGFVSDHTDCDDANSNVNPSKTETCNSIDDNCDGNIDEGVKTTFYFDGDNDGYGAAGNFTTACVIPFGYVANPNDCDDTNAGINPFANETCNAIDDNCNGSIDEGVQSIFYADADQDGYGNANVTVNACTAPSGFTTDHSDCNDANNMIHPGAAEICNGLDDDCSGQIDDNLSNGVAVLWQKTFGGTNGDAAQSMDYTLDGGYIIAGSSLSDNGNLSSNKGKNDYWIVKTDGSGTLLWQKSYGGTGDDIAYSVKATTDGGYAVVGTSSSLNNGDVTGNHGGGDFWLIKLDGSGNLQWQKSFGGSGSDIPYSLYQTNDGGFVLAGMTKSSNGDVTGNHSSGDYWLVKTDATGALQWQKTYGGSAFDFAHAVQQTTDGGYLLSGFARSNDGDVTLAYGQEDMWILKLDAIGNISWQKTYGGTGGEGASYLQQTSDGGYILTGVTHSFNIDVVGNHGTEHDFWVVKIDASGNKQWTKCLGGFDTENSHWIRQTKDGGFLVCGSGDSNDGDATFNHGKHDFWVVKVNSAGALQWQKSLGGTQDDEANAVLENSDGTIVIAGYAASNDGDVSGNHGGMDFWLVKCSVPTLNTFYIDSDGDTYGSLSSSTTACSAPPGYSSNATDCNDANPNVHPGAPEICNGIDDDCNSLIDENGVVATIVPLATLSICKGTSLTYSCNTDPSFTYQWYNKGFLISGATNSTYTATIAGTYSVKISNGSCSATSAASILKFATLISVKPKGTTVVCAGVTVTFAVTETPGVNYQWHNATSAIAGATGTSYNTSTPGTYYMVETDYNGCTTSSNSSILQTLAAAIVKITNTGSLNICNTGSVTLNAQVQSGYTYLWYKNSAPISGATGTTYKVTSAGTYKYLATTSSGCTKFSANKNVVGCKSEAQSDGSDLKVDLEVYPNPSDGTFYCSFTSENDLSGTAQISVCNSLGQLLFARKAEIVDGSFSDRISMPEETPQGFYFLKFSFNGYEYAKPIELLH